jgi:hypothetical protein
MNKNLLHESPRHIQNGNGLLLSKPNGDRDFQEPRGKDANSIAEFPSIDLYRGNLELRLIAIQ